MGRHGERITIAFMGIRGIPASYSGFETFVEETAIRLAALGHDVVVYNRRGHYDAIYRDYHGIRIVTLPSLGGKHVETISHTFLSVLHAVFRRYDIVYLCGVGNSPLAALVRLAGSKVLINVDGEDWAREKWGWLAKQYLKMAENVACVVGNYIVADSTVIARRYLELYARETVHIPYGANIVPRPKDGNDCQTLSRFGLEPEQYILFVGRLEPENGAHILIEAYRSVKTNKRLVIVGDAPYNEKYVNSIKRAAGERVIFTGFLFGNAYREISQHAYLFVLPSGVDGTRPVLLDQMGFGNCVLVRNSAANMEVIDAAGFSFDKNELVNSLSAQLNYLDGKPDQVRMFRRIAQERAQTAYSWDLATQKYVHLFEKLTNKQT